MNRPYLSTGFRNIYFDSEEEFDQFVSSSEYRAIESESFSKNSNHPNIVIGKIPVIIYALFPEYLNEDFITPPNNLYRIVKYWNKDVNYEIKLTPLKVKVVLLSLIEKNGVEVGVDEKFIRSIMSNIDNKLKNNTKQFSLTVKNLDYRGGQSDKNKIIKELELRKDEIYFDDFNFLSQRKSVNFEIVGDSYKDLIMKVEEHRLGFLYYNIKLI